MKMSIGFLINIILASMFMFVLCLLAFLYADMTYKVTFPFWQPLEHRHEVETRMGTFYVAPDPWEPFRSLIPDFRAPHEGPIIPDVEEPTTEDGYMGV